MVSAGGSVALLLVFSETSGYVSVDFCAVISLAGPRCQGNVQLFSTETTYLEACIESHKYESLNGPS